MNFATLVWSKISWFRVGAMVVEHRVEYICFMFALIDSHTWYIFSYITTISYIITTVCQHRTFPHFWGELAHHQPRPPMWCQPKALGEPIKVDSTMDSTGVLRADWQDTAWLSPERRWKMMDGMPDTPLEVLTAGSPWDFGYAPFPVWRFRLWKTHHGFRWTCRSTLRV